ncbi:MAG: riboflavin biosynthesis protein RibF [Clostridia bacterium]
MKIVENGYDKNIVVALGLFDSVHRGHTRLIDEAKKLAEFLGAECAVFTFKNNPFVTFKQNTGLVFTFEERLPIFQNLGVDVVIAKTMDTKYALTSPEAFLVDLFSQFKISAVVCGTDFTFGHGGAGDVDMLRFFAASKGAIVKQMELLRTESGEKISSTLIRTFIENGEIALANQLLGRAYRIMGNVVHCFGRGRAYGFPTANIFVPEEKNKMSQGVYATTVEVDGFVYDSLTNIGIKPTFNDYTLTVESFLENYKGNLYGKDITVRFYKKIRNIVKFNSEDEIHEQILRDIEIGAMIKRTL